MQINENKIMDELRQLENIANHSKVYLALQMGIGYSTFWKRCKRASWTYDDVVVLAETMARITGKDVEVWSEWVVGEVVR